MSAIFLSEPKKDYQKSFKSYVLSYQDHQEEYYYHKYQPALENFDQYIHTLWDYAKGLHIPP